MFKKKAKASGPALLTDEVPPSPRLTIRFSLSCLEELSKCIRTNESLAEGYVHGTSVYAYTCTYTHICQHNHLFHLYMTLTSFFAHDIVRTSCSMLNVGIYSDAHLRVQI